jgi:acetyl-CoA acetyltransferase
MKEVVIVDAVRTPVGNHGGMLRDLDSVALAQVVIKGYWNERKLILQY